MSSPSLAYLDLVFCVDVTASMTPFIVAARAHMAEVLDALRDNPDVDLRVAIVTYRDHGSGKVVEVHPFAEAAADTGLLLEALTVGSPPENTDSAEAVFSGLVACIDLPWRVGAYRVVVLVGDRFPDRDPTGLTVEDMVSRLDAAGIAVHALAMIPSQAPHHDPVLEQAFERLGNATGGAYHTANTGDAAMSVVDRISQRCLSQLDFDRRLHELLPDDGSEPDAEILAPQLGATVTDVYAGVIRLRQRHLR
ncbi:MAG: hypothetical protein H6Q90_6226 [Deltaproteobacteria bacterium]|nr:hypothetical protein [Deltaproteobacteria bacterium]